MIVEVRQPKANVVAIRGHDVEVSGVDLLVFRIRSDLAQKVTSGS